MFRRMVIALWLVLLALTFTHDWNVCAEEPENRNPVEWVEQLETQLYGKQISGNLLERLAGLEETTVGRMREGSLVERLSYLNTLFFENQPYDICVTYKIQVLEWILFHQVNDGTYLNRVDKLEQSLFGTVYTGPMNNRLQKLFNQVFQDGTLNGHWVSIPEDLAVKVKIDDELSSGKNSAGDSFRYTVVETLAYHDMVVIPKGTVGYGKITHVIRPGNLGVDARLMLDFQSIRSLDSTMIPLVYRGDRLGINRPRQLAVGASAAGMLILGPEGILMGMAIRGDEKVIPPDAEVFVHIKKPVRVYTVAM